MLEQNQQAIRDAVCRLDRPVTMMEICGTHTMAAFRAGLRTLLPDTLRLISGPGCPVCVTPLNYLDRVLSLAKEPGVMIATFGDMLRVPGSVSSLEKARAQGADVLVVYSPMDALQAAERYPDKQVVFLGVGFETTAPAVAWSIKAANTRRVTNYSVFCAHKTIPTALAALLSDHEIQIDGLICPGHVSVITGSQLYDFVARDFHIPCVVTGFEPLDMIQGVAMLLDQMVQGVAAVQIQYQRSVTRTGNPIALDLLAEVFAPCDADWRGVGSIPGSGLCIQPLFAHIDAEKKFSVLQEKIDSYEPKGCRCGEIIRGVCTPLDCPLFGKACNPSNPVGACMVSGEGTCAAYYKYGKH